MTLQAGDGNAQRMSLDDIAASMITAPDAEEQDVVNAEPEEEINVSSEPSDVADNIEKGEEAEDDVLDAADDDSEADSEDGDDTDADVSDDSDGEDFEAFELTEDTIVTVTVDGEQQEVTLADLKKNYSGTGAIEKRLQEATEARKAARAEYDTALEERQALKQELETGRSNLVKAFQAFDAMMFQPTMPEPDPALRASNPTEYLIQQDNYAREQQELASRRQKVQSAVQQYQQQEAQQLETKKQEAAKRLMEAMPALADPNTRQQTQELILEGARAYGFTNHEIQNAYDERMFQMAADAAAYRRLQEKTQVSPKPAVKGKKPKVLKPGASTAQRQGSAYARQQKAKLQQARKSGSVDDVAATMIVRKPKR